MDEGAIKSINERGFGFIHPHNAGSDIFFHASALVGVTLDELRRGDRVTYTSDPDPRGKGPRATEVRRAP